MARRKRKNSPEEALFGFIFLGVAYAIFSGHGRQLFALAFSIIALLIVAIVIVGIRRKTPITRQSRIDKADTEAAAKRAQARERLAAIPQETSPKPIVEPPKAIEQTNADTMTPAWSLNLIRTLEWRRFEVLCEELWRSLGYRAESTGAGADGGIDIKLYTALPEHKLFAIVQCKSRIRENIGVAFVRELFGVMHHINVKMGILMTSTDFHPDAKKFAEGKHIQLIGGERLLQRILTLTPEKQSALLTKVTAGDYLTPTCPKCYLKMKLVTGKPPRPDFWGCQRWPSCQYKQQIRNLDRF